MITYQLERWLHIVDELEPMFMGHWEEIALHKDAVPLAPDWDRYRRMDLSDELHVVTCRLDGKLIGYHVSLITTGLHYRHTLFALVDIYYLLPEYRKGRIGIDLFREVERTWAKRGVVKAISGSKVKLDLTKLFEHLGWERTEIQFSKLIRPPK